MLHERAVKQEELQAGIQICKSISMVLHTSNALTHYCKSAMAAAWGKLGLHDACLIVEIWTPIACTQCMDGAAAEGKCTAGLDLV